MLHAASRTFELEAAMSSLTDTVRAAMIGNAGFRPTDHPGLSMATLGPLVQRKKAELWGSYEESGCKEKFVTLLQLLLAAQKVADAGKGGRGDLT